MRQQLIKKFNDRSAVIAIVGMGYVGLPLMHARIAIGYELIKHHAGLIIDTRGVYLEPTANVVRA